MQVAAGRVDVGMAQVIANNFQIGLFAQVVGRCPVTGGSGGTYRLMQRHVSIEQLWNRGPTSQTFERCHPPSNCHHRQKQKSLLSTK